MVKLMMAAEGIEVAAYEDNVSGEELLPLKPEPGSIIKESYIEEVGVTELILSNGIRVALKPTDFKNDEILFASFSPGGSSLVNDEDYMAASAAASKTFIAYLGFFL